MLNAVARVRRHLPLARRADMLELLDGETLPTGELETNLTDLARLNRLPGGSVASATGIGTLLDGRGGRVLDVGTGLAHMPISFARRGWEVVALDARPDIAALARRETHDEPGIEIVVGDGRAIPFPNASFDVAHSSLLLHHLDPPAAVATLREMGRVARLGVVVNDLQRGMIHLMATGVGVALLGRCRTTRHDGLLSARRAYTLAELDGLLAAAGLAVQRRSAPWLPRVVTTAVPEGGR